MIIVLVVAFTGAIVVVFGDSALSFEDHVKFIGGAAAGLGIGRGVAAPARAWGRPSKMAALASSPVSSKRRRGYLVWACGPGDRGSRDHGRRRLGRAALHDAFRDGRHLERRWNWVELIVVAAIVFAFFSAVRVRPQPERAEDRGVDDSSAGSSGKPGRIVGGRLTLRRPAVQQARSSPTRPRRFSSRSSRSHVCACRRRHLGSDDPVDDRHHYQPAYFLYGLLGLLWLVIPGALAFAWGADLPFPTLFRTVNNLKDWLRERSWPLALGRCSLGLSPT
jgi:hypothetical protein